jgi:hypothetical protein
MLFCTACGLGHVLFLDDLDAGHLLQLGRGLGVRLVVAVVVRGPT